MRKNLLLLPLVATLLLGCATTTADYQLDSTRTYFVSGKQCTQYNVITEKNLSDKELVRIYGEVMSGHKDNMYQHKVSFYSSEEMMKDGIVDIAEVVEKSGNDYELYRAK